MKSSLKIVVIMIAILLLSTSGYSQTTANADSGESNKKYRRSNTL